MSASRVVGLIVVSSWLLIGCGDSSKKIAVGGACVLNTDCSASLVCTMGKCHDACHGSADCPTGQSCVKVNNTPVCQLPVEKECRNTPCGVAFVCASDLQCRTPCQTVANCANGQVCVTNVCADPSDLDVNGQLPQKAPADGGPDQAAERPLGGGDTATLDVSIPIVDAGNADILADMPLGTPDVPVVDSGESEAGKAMDSGLAQDAPGPAAKTCKGNSECDSMHCMDGYCCDKSCSGTCEACNVAGLEGTCSPIPKGQDPAAECPDKAPCASTCDGKRACSPVCGEIGAACAVESDCTLVHCVDGYCCDTLCSGFCEACNVQGKEGTCSPVPAGKDPADECDADLASTCGLNGLCDGAGLCQHYGAETSCTDGQDICSSGDHCDGKGTCVGGQNAPNFTSCTVVTTPDYDYDICVHGKCVSPGTCADASCNAPSFHFPLPDTGQRQCQNADAAPISCPGSAGGVACADTDYCGQDAQYGWDLTHATTERFARAGTWDPTVTDNITGLMWQGCPAGLNASACTNGSVTTHPIADALAYCASSSWAGHTDWHLPDRFEALSIGPFGLVDGPDPTSFPNLPTYSAIWTSATSWLMQITYNASDRLDPGRLSHGDPYNSPNLTLCVRGSGTARSAARYSRTTSYEPVVSDSDTGLMWQGCAAGINGASCATGTVTTHNWHDALQYCQAITWGSYDDWYLPSVLELHSITDGALIGSAFDDIAFPTTPVPVPFVSATPTADSNGDSRGSVWTVNFADGANSYAMKTNVLAVRCVRKPN